MSHNAPGLPDVVVVERVLHRYQVSGIWFVEFEAFDPDWGAHLCQCRAFSTGMEAYQFQAGCAVNWHIQDDDTDIGLPF